MIFNIFIRFLEAFAAGCAVIGDVPGDVNLARFVQATLARQSASEIGYSSEKCLAEYDAGNECSEMVVILVDYRIVRF